MNIMRLLMLALAVSATPSYATVIFSDQFGTQATGADASLSADVGSWGSLGSTSTGTIFSPVTDIGNVMGSGTNNGILHVQDLSSSGNVGMQATFSQAASYGTISFDFYQSIVDNTVTSGNRYFRIQLVSGATEAYRMDFLNTGNYMRTPSPYSPSGTFSQENLIHIDMYFNSTNSAMTVGSVTLNAQSFLLYINGVYVGSGIYANNVSSVSGIRFYTGTANVADDYIDNFVVTNAVPEPASLALLALGGLAALRRACAS